MLSASKVYVFEEQRGSERIKSSFQAKGLVNEFESGFDCRLIDISETGARIAVRNVDIPPKRIKLFIPDTKMLYECEVVRKTADELGLRFTSNVSLQPT